MEKKTAKALYDLLKELYQSRAAKEFVDVYEREEQVREWSIEDFECWLKPTDSVRRKMFPDHVCDEEKHESPKPKREKPQSGETYRDIFGNRYTVLDVIENFSDGTLVDKAFVSLFDMNKWGILTPTLEQFMNPKFTKE